MRPPSERDPCPADTTIRPPSERDPALRILLQPGTWASGLLFRSRGRVKLPGTHREFSVKVQELYSQVSGRLQMEICHVARSWKLNSRCLCTSIWRAKQYFELLTFTGQNQGDTKLLVESKEVF